MKKLNLQRTESLPNLTAIGERHLTQSRDFSIELSIKCPPSNGETSVDSKNYGLVKKYIRIFSADFKMEERPCWKSNDLY